jgi:hypothetical protein
MEINMEIPKKNKNRPTLLPHHTTLVHMSEGVSISIQEKYTCTPSLLQLSSQ